MALLPALLPIIGRGLDRVIPDPEAKARATAELARMDRDGELKNTELQLSAILAEAQSADPWTSRARPSFLYVMYLMILVSVPMGILFAFSPTTASDITQGVQAWLAALPEELWWLFGTGYLGYAGARSFDKARIARNGGNR